MYFPLPSPFHSLFPQSHRKTLISSLRFPSDSGDLNLFIPTMPKKDCGKHASYYRHKIYRRIFACLLTLIIIILFIILVIWLVLRPTKPKFLLQDASIYQFNLTSGTNLLSPNLQVTIYSRNPNDRIGIYYDRLDAFAEYKNDQITGATGLPTGYQGHNDVNIWSPFLSSIAVPVSPYIVGAMGEDENAGFMLIYIKIVGRLRWKVGSWISDHYHIDVSCPAFFNVVNGRGNGGLTEFRFQRMTSCTVDV